MNRLKTTIFLLFWFFCVGAQETIPDLTVNFEPGDVFTTTIDAGGNCSSLPFVWGIANSSFVANNADGTSCCGPGNNFGLNNNLFGFISAPLSTPYALCDASVEVFARTDGILEPCINGDLNQIGCTASGVGSSGNDGITFQIGLLSGGPILLEGGYCGDQRLGSFRVDNLSIGRGEALNFLFVGGNQEGTEFYYIDSIVVKGSPASFVTPFTIQRNISGSFCEGQDPIVLTVTPQPSNVSYEWSLNGVLLPGVTGPTFSTNGTAELTNAGAYSVTIRDGCTTGTTSTVVNVTTCAPQTATFPDLPTIYCQNTDTLFLPSISDEGFLGTWDLNPVVILDTLPFTPTEVTFTPNDINIPPVTIPIVVDGIEAVGLFNEFGYIYCFYNDENTFINLDSDLSLNAASIANMEGFGQTWTISELQNLDLSAFPNGLYEFIITSVPGPQGICAAYMDTVEITIDILERGMDHVALICETATANNSNFNQLIDLTLGRDGVWENPGNVNIDLSDPTDVDLSNLRVGNYQFQYIVEETCIVRPADTAFLDIEILASFQTEIREVRCEGDPFFVIVDGVRYDALNPTGSESLTAANGCDSTVVIDLIFQPLERITVSPTGLCAGDLYDTIINNVTYNEVMNSGVETLAGRNGDCDTVVTIDLIFSPLSGGEEHYDGCEGDPYSVIVNGQLYNEANPRGSETLLGINGCDSTVIIDLNYKPDTTVSFDYIGMENDGFFQIINGIRFDESNPTDTLFLTASNLCDSTIYINFIFSDVPRDTILDTICMGDVLDIVTLNSTYNEQNPSGFDTLQATDGSDSIIFFTEITVLPSGIANIDITTTAGRGFDTLINGINYNESFPSNSDTIFGGADNMCDSIINVNIVFLNEIIIANRDTFCVDDPTTVVIGNSTYSNANPIGRDTFTTSLGTDSIVITELLFLDSIINRFEANACFGDGFDTIFNGILFNESNPTDTILLSNEGTNGCDSFIYVNILFSDFLRGNNFDTTCMGEPLEVMVGSSTYNEANPSGYDTLSTSGKDSIVFTNLTFLSPAVTDINLTRLTDWDSVIAGVNYSILNDENFTILFGRAANGCDSIINVKITFLEEVVVDNDLLFCPGELGIEMVGNSIYDITNPTGRDTFRRTGNSDSIVVTNLTFLDTAINIFERSGCIGDGFSIPFNGLVYDEFNPTDTIILPGQAFNSCDSFIYVRMTFGDDVIIENLDTLCIDGSVDIGQSTYDIDNLSGSDTLRSNTGCDTIINTQITIDSIGIDLCVKESCPQSSTGSIVIYNLDPSKLLGLNFENQDFEFTDSLVLSDLGMGDYDLNLSTVLGCTRIVTTSVTELDLFAMINEIELGLDSSSLEVMTNAVLDSVKWSAESGIICESCTTVNIDTRISNRYFLEAFSTNGCILRDTLVINPIPDDSALQYYIPNIFSPNASAGNNVFYMFSEDSRIVDYDLEIFNRWGNLIFSNRNAFPNDNSSAWDGTFNGAGIAIDVYIYRITVRTTDGSETSILGDILLIK